MPAKKFDFFNDRSEDQQNHFLRQYLTDTTKYLEPNPFPNSPGYFFYEGAFVDDATNSNSIGNLATLLVLLVKRDFLWPIRFNKGNPTHPMTGTPAPYYVFVADIKELNEPDFSSFEYYDLDEASKGMLN